MKPSFLKNAVALVSCGLLALATPDLWAYFVYHAATFLLYPKRPKT